MSSDQFDLFIAYHGTGSSNGSTRKALDLYNFLCKAGWKPYFVFERGGVDRFTDTPTFAMRSRAFLLIANENLPLDEKRKLKSSYISNEIASFIVKRDCMYKAGVPDAQTRLRGYVYGGLTPYQLTLANGNFAGSPTFVEKEQEEEFAKVEAWLRESLKKSIGEREEPDESKLPTDIKRENGFCILASDEPLEMRQRNEESESLYHLPFEWHDDFVSLIRQMMHDYADGNADPALFSYLLNAGGVSDEFCRIFFALSANDPVCHKVTYDLYREAQKKQNDCFLNFFHEANSSIQLYPEEDGAYDASLVANNEKKMNIRRIVIPEVGQNRSFSWGRILYSDFIKVNYCDYPFIDGSGQRTTLREKYMHGDRSSFLGKVPASVPNEAGVGVILFTKDGKILFQKRNGVDNLMFFHDLFSYASSGSINTERDYDKCPHGASSSYAKDQSFVPYNAIVREAYEELGIPLNDEDEDHLYLYSFGYDFDACHYQFTYICFCSLSAMEINASASGASDGFGREINSLYAMDLLNLFRKGEPIKPEYVDLLSNAERFEGGCFANLKKILLYSRKLKEWACQLLEKPEEFTRDKLKESIWLELRSKDGR